MSGAQWVFQIVQEMCGGSMARLLDKTDAFCRNSKFQSWLAHRWIWWPLHLPGILFWPIALRVPQRPILQPRLWCFHANVFTRFFHGWTKCFVFLLFFHLLTNQGQKEELKMEMLLKFLPQHDENVQGSVLSLQLIVEMVKVIKRYPWELAVREQSTDFRSKAPITWYAQWKKPEVRNILNRTHQDTMHEYK